jgi:hypothetical protein
MFISLSLLELFSLREMLIDVCVKSILIKNVIKKVIKENGSC